MSDYSGFGPQQPSQPISVPPPPMPGTVGPTAVGNPIASQLAAKSPVLNMAQMQQLAAALRQYQQQPNPQLQTAQAGNGMAPQVGMPA